MTNLLSTNTANLTPTSFDSFENTHLSATKSPIMPTCLSVSGGGGVRLEDESDQFYGSARYLQTGGIPQRLAQIGERTSSPWPTWVDLKMRFPPVSADNRYLQRQRAREASAVGGGRRTLGLLRLQAGCVDLRDDWNGMAKLSASTRWRCVNVYSFNRTKCTDLGDGRCVSEDGRVLNFSARGSFLRMLTSDIIITILRVSVFQIAGAQEINEGKYGF